MVHSPSLNVKTHINEHLFGQCETLYRGWSEMWEVVTLWSVLCMNVLNEPCSLNWRTECIHLQLMNVAVMHQKAFCQMPKTIRGRTVLQQQPRICSTGMCTVSSAGNSSNRSHFVGTFEKLLSTNQVDFTEEMPKAVFKKVLLTVIAVVVDQDYLFEEVGGRPVDCRMDGPQDDGQGFVHKNEHNAHLRKV